MTDPFTIGEHKRTDLLPKRLDFLYDQNWFKMFVPADYGGLQLSLTEGAIILTRVASLQGGMGWALNLGTGANWFSGFFHPETAKNLYSPRKTVTAGSGFTGGTYKQTDSGMVLNGSWSKCSGAAHATLFSLNATRKSGEVSSFIVPEEEVTLADEKWPIMGLRNASSYAIDLNDVVVPEEYAFQINDVKNHENYRVFHIPFEMFARVCMASSFIGIVRCLIEGPEKEMSLLIEKKDAQDEVWNLEQSLEKFETIRNEFAEELEHRAFKNNTTDAFKAQLRETLGHNNLKLFNQVQKLFLKGGLPFVEEDQRIHWAYRDVLTAVQHFMVKP